MPRERTHLRYQLYKSEARKLARLNAVHQQHEQVRKSLGSPDLSKLRFEPIDAQALKAFDQWDDPQFLWSEVVAWKAREPLALDVAIWFDDVLCGMCVANPNKSRHRIRIVRLEGCPSVIHPLKKRIAPLSMLVIEHYAQIIGSRIIEVQEPLKGAVSTYQRLGFNFDAEGRLVKSIEGIVL